MVSIMEKDTFKSINKKSMKVNLKMVNIKEREFLRWHKAKELIKEIL